MKKILLFLSVLCCTLGAVSAQTGQAILDRYNQVTGLDKLTPELESSVMLSAKTDMQGMSMPMKIVIADGGNKARIEMSMMGMDILVVMNGGQGWISMPGEGVQELPADMLAQFQQQLTVTNNYRWDPEAFEFTAEGEVTEGGKTLQKVRFTPRKGGMEEVRNLTGYFDKATGLAQYITMDVVEGGTTMNTRVELEDYKTFDGYKIPSRYDITVADGLATVSMEITDLKYGYNAPESLFAKP